MTRDAVARRTCPAGTPGQAGTRTRPQNARTTAPRRATGRLQMTTTGGDRVTKPKQKMTRRGAKALQARKRLSARRGQPLKGVSQTPSRCAAYLAITSSSLRRVFLAAAPVHCPLYRLFLRMNVRFTLHDSCKNAAVMRHTQRQADDQAERPCNMICMLRGLLTYELLPNAVARASAMTGKDVLDAAACKRVRSITSPPCRHTRSQRWRRRQRQSSSRQMHCH